MGQVPLHTPPQPLGVPHAAPAGQLGAQAQRPPEQVWPAGHEPLQTPPQPSAWPQVAPAGQFGAQAQRPPEHRWPVGQVPLQTPPHPSGVPHAAPAGQFGAQQRPAVQVCPPGQVPLQTPPQPSGAPQAEVAQQFGRHAAQVPFSQRVPAGQRSQPQVDTQRPAWQRSPAAQVTPAQGSRTHVPAWHTKFAGQRTPAHESLLLHARVQTSPLPHGDAQGTMRSQRSLSGLHTKPASQRTPWQGTWKHPGTQVPFWQVCPPGHCTHSHGSRCGRQRVVQVCPSPHASELELQNPPQPSGAPQVTPAGQCGTQAPQRPFTQRWPDGQVPQPHESTQRPLSHTKPARQVTPAQGFATQRPLRHDWPSGQRTPAQRSGGSHATCGWKPSGHIASHARRATQRLVCGSQKLPAGQRTPRQGKSKQPGTHAPSMQVWPVGHTTCAQGSCVRTQRAWQTVPAGHSVADVAHGEGVQRLLTHTSPAAHSVSRLHVRGTSLAGVSTATSGVGASVAGVSRAGVSVAGVSVVGVSATAVSAASAALSGPASVPVVVGGQPIRSRAVARPSRVVRIVADPSRAWG